MILKDINVTNDFKQNKTKHDIFRKSLKVNSIRKIYKYARDLSWYPNMSKNLIRHTNLADIAKTNTWCIGFPVEKRYCKRSTQIKWLIGSCVTLTASVGIGNQWYVKARTTFLAHIYRIEKGCALEYPLLHGMYQRLFSSFYHPSSHIYIFTYIHLFTQHRSPSTEKSHPWKVCVCRWIKMVRSIECVWVHCWAKLLWQSANSVHCSCKN